MLKFFMDKDIDYLEVFFDQTPNYGEEDESGVLIFKSEINNSIVGYGFFSPFILVPHTSHLSPKLKIAVMCFMKRNQEGISEKAMAEKLGLSYRTYQRIEEGEISKIDDLIKISDLVPDLDFSNLFKAS